MSNQDKEPKIIVDEDWKTQVEREKEQLKQHAKKSSAPEGSTGEIPPASFSILVTTYATQALVCLGYLPDPVSREAKVDRTMAKHFIDMLDVLEKKTRGNLGEDEDALLTDALHQLRMAYVASSHQTPDEGPAKPKSTIELP
jgi:hypothetical protein